MDLVPLSFNLHKGGGFFSDYWWAVLIVAVIIISVVMFITLNNSGSNTGSSVSLQKKSIDGEEVYVKTVDGEEVPLTEEDKKQIADAESAALAQANTASAQALKQIEEAKLISQQAMNQALEASNAGLELATQVKLDLPVNTVN